MKNQFILSIRDHMRTRHYASKTIQAYLSWITQFIVYHKMAHPSTLSEKHVEEFLTYLAVEQKVAAKTQALALNAIMFLYREYFRTPLNSGIKFQKSLLDRKLPVVLTKVELRFFSSTRRPTLQTAYHVTLWFWTSCHGVRPTEDSRH